jgi:putative phosphoesterase
VKTALISDIHGNAVALEAVLAELDADQVVCLGDAVQGGPQPVEVLDRLAALGWSVVLGNADAHLLEPEAGPERFREIGEWTVSQLSPGHLEQIRGFEPRVSLEIGDRRLLVFHGGPDDYDQLLLPWTPIEELRAAFEPYPADLYAGGHTHQQFVRRVGAAQFVNPGSVGLSWDWDSRNDDEPGFDHYACYALLGERSIEFRRVAFDVQPLLELYRERGLPGAEATIGQWRR